MINGDDDLDKAEEKFNRDDAAFSDRHTENTNRVSRHIAKLSEFVARAEALSKSSDNANMVICFDHIAQTFKDNLAQFMDGKQASNLFGMNDPPPILDEYLEAMSLVTNCKLPEVDLDQVRVAVDNANAERLALEDKAYHEFIEKFGVITACEIWSRWDDSRVIMVHQEIEKSKAYEKDLKAKAKSDLAAAKAKVKKNKDK